MYNAAAGLMGMGGGGASDVRTSKNDLTSRLLVAGGSGGLGMASSSQVYYGMGGFADCPNGGDGYNVNSGVTNSGGDGGDQDSGGAGGTYAASNSGATGALGNGGAAGAGGSGGGGGGGYYGGGGGSNNGGGGGSSYYPTPTAGSIYVETDCSYPSYIPGNGQITVYYSPYVPVVQTFEYTSSTQSFTLPDDVTDVYMEVLGGAGSNSDQGLGGGGAFMAVNFTVNDNSYRDLTITVGSYGGGYGGGGSSGCTSAGVGGGATTVKSDGVVVVIAGGGGGAGYDASCVETCTNSSINGGWGGFASSNTTGDASPLSNVSYGGGGGSSYQGGRGGYYPPSTYGVAGASTQGGVGNACGGGGGYFGGGGGANTGGGGGSSYIQSLQYSGWSVVVDASASGANPGAAGKVVLYYVSAAGSADDDTNTDSSSDDPTEGVIAGSSIGAACGFVAILGVAYFFRARRIKKDRLLNEQHIQDQASAPPADHNPVHYSVPYHNQAALPDHGKGPSAPPESAPEYAEARVVRGSMDLEGAIPVEAVPLHNDKV